MKTLENNKLIAEFLSVKIHPCETIENFKFLPIEERGLYNGYFIDELKYHEDWNWLMEVVEKIESLEIFDRMGRFNINTKNFDENYTSFITDKDEDFIQCEGDTKIEAVYNAVVEFIKWYNTQNNFA